ncbi:MAG TPA: hypothetical protein VMW28_00150 [Pelolinea sp.]|nr:hypothetical protein [Pelolinea sp.]
MAEQKKNKDEMNQTESGEQPSGRRFRRLSSPWVGGAALILIGLVFLLQNTTGFYLNNWWAFFIMIPAVSAFGNALRGYQNADRKFTSSVRSSLIGGLVMTMIAAIFLFNLDWLILGPAILILAGIGLLLSSFVK